MDKKIMAMLATNGPLTGAQLSWLTGAQLSWLTRAQLSWLTRAQLSWLTGAQLSWLTRAQLSWLTRAQLSWLTRAQLSWLTGAQLSWLTGAQLSELDLLAGKTGPKIDKPYSRMLADIKAGQRIHNQKEWGPDCDPETNLCKTPMCTAGHLVNMAGEDGYKLKEKYGWQLAATIIHRASRPDVPPQNFGGIPQEWALAYIEERAAEEV